MIGFPVCKPLLDKDAVGARCTFVMLKHCGVHRYLNCFKSAVAKQHMHEVSDLLMQQTALIFELHF